MSQTIQISVPLEDEFLGDILVTAFDGDYGGCWYWAEPNGSSWLKTNQVHDPCCSLWLTVDINEKDDEHQSFTVTHATVAEGIKKILDGTVKVGEPTYAYISRAVREQDAGDIDADAADSIVQVAVFGELKYG